MFKLFKALAIATILAPSILHGIIHTITSFDEVKDAIEQSDRETLWAFDLDEVCVVASDKVLQLEKYRNMIRGLIENEYEENFGEYGGYIFKQHKYQIVDPKVREVLQALSEKQVKNIAFTSRSIASFYVKNLLKHWKYQLNFLQLKFYAFPGICLPLGDARFNGRTALFCDDVLYTNGLSKEVVLEVFLENFSYDFKPKKICFIDDRLENLEKVETWCSIRGINFIGFHFTAIQEWHKGVVINEKHIKERIRYLILYKKWLSDQQASEIIGRNEDK